MIDLYTASTPNGWKASVTLEELGLPYEVKALSLTRGEQKTAKFLKINPNGRIPAIVDRSEGDFAIFESGAILVNLAEKAGRLLPSSPKGRSLALQWLMFQMSAIGPMMGQANVFLRYFAEKLQPAIDRYQNECRRLFEVLTAGLNKPSTWRVTTRSPTSRRGAGCAHICGRAWRSTTFSTLWLARRGRGAACGATRRTSTAPCARARRGHRI